MSNKKAVITIIILSTVAVFSITNLIVNNWFEAAEVATEIFVSPDGNDDWLGTKDQPVKTIAKASTLARLYRGSINIYLRDGIYDLSAGLSLTAADSGRNGIISYRSYPGESAILRGSKDILGVAPIIDEGVVGNRPASGDTITGSSYQIDLAGSGISGAAVNAFYINGALQTLARYPNYVSPNYNNTDPWAGNFLYTTSDTPSSKNLLAYESSLTRPNNWGNPSTGYINVFSGPNYSNSIVPISSINTANKTISLGADVSYNLIPNNRFFAQNILEEMDMPGEWFKEAQSNKIFFIPPNGLDIATSRFSIPSSSSVISIDGAENLRFSKLVIEEADKGINIQNGKNISVDNSIFHNITTQGIYAYGSSQKINIDGNSIYDLGEIGVWVNQSDSSIRKTLTQSEIVITNNHIYRVGLVKKDSPAIRVTNVVGARIAHNDIHDVPRVGIGYIGNDSTIESNNIYNTNQETSDTGAIYTNARSWLYRGNVIRNNKIRETGGYARLSNGWTYNAYSSGIYLDDFTSGTQVYNNLILRASRAGVQVHGGRDNSITNNIIVEPTMTDAALFLDGISESNVWFPTMWSELESMQANGFDKSKYFSNYPELSTISQAMDNTNNFSANRISKNILYFPNHPQTNPYYVRNFINSPGGLANNNIFWNNGINLRVSHPETAGGSLSWSQWNDFGYDTNSLIADPLFKDAAKDNYEISPDSPAFKVGFEPFITTSVGTNTNETTVLNNSISSKSKETVSSSKNNKNKATVAPSKPAELSSETVSPPAELTVPEKKNITLNSIPQSDRYNFLGLFLTRRQYEVTLSVFITLLFFAGATLSVVVPRLFAQHRKLGQTY